MRVGSRRLTPIYEEFSGASLTEEESCLAGESEVTELDLTQTTTSSSNNSWTPLSPSDWIDVPFWPWFWQGGTLEALARFVQAHRAEIALLKEEVRPTLEPIFGLEKALSENGTYFIDPSQLALIPNGISGSYFLSDETGEKRFIAKPLDEDIAGLNNPKGYGSPNGPIFLAVFREIAVYATAKTIGVNSIAPPTALAILKSDAFFDIADYTEYRELGPANKEKLCSLQEFVLNSKTLFESAQDLQQEGLTDDEIAARFDQNDFESANILLWATGETDGHMGNFLTYPKGLNEEGNQILGLKKIDNGLSFPAANGRFFNALSYLPNAGKALSDAGREKILAIDPEQISDILRQNKLVDSILPMEERIEHLKMLVADPNITIKEINQRLSKFEISEGTYEKPL